MVVTVFSSEDEFHALAMRLAAKVLLPGTGWVAFALLMSIVCLTIGLCTGEEDGYDACLDSPEVLRILPQKLRILPQKLRILPQKLRLDCLCGFSGSTADSSTETADSSTDSSKSDTSAS